MRTSSRPSNNPFAATVPISEEQANEYFHPFSSITMPVPTHYPPPASMTPDNMLRLYAERQAARLSPNKPIQHTSKGETALAVAAHQTTCFARTLCARVRFSSGIPAVENWRNGLPSLEARVRL